MSRFLSAPHGELMEFPPKEKPALLVIDMVKDSLDPKKNLPITQLAMQIVEPINHLAQSFRKASWPVVFATDAFRREDFIFTGKMRPYSLQGTPGAQVAEVLKREAEDLWLPKPRFSAFFRTGLDEWLKTRRVTLCAVAGITTNFCVMTTAMDAICCDFKTVILEDCTTASSNEIHKKTLEIYRRNALFPLLRVMTSKELVEELF
jgi:nicotinamidase/pyrazinamidase